MSRSEQLCAAERAAVCDLADQSAFRAVLIRTAEDQHRFVLDQSPHRDGWLVDCRSCCRRCSPVITGSRLPAAASYRSFVSWLAGQDRDAALAAWREVFAGFETPTLVGPPGRLRLGRRGVESFQVSERNHAGAERVGALHAHDGQHGAAGRVGAAADVADRSA